MKRSMISMLSVVVVLSLATVSQGAVVYQSDFTGDDLASTGLTQAQYRAASTWILNTNDYRVEVDFAGTADRSTLYTTNSWQSDSGFSMEVRFKHAADGTRFSFGIVDAGWTVANLDWVDYKSVYGIGFTLDGTVAGGAGGDPLVFVTPGSASVLSTDQGLMNIGTEYTLFMTVTSNSWSYSLNGAAPTTGSFATPFDTSKSYRFVSNAHSRNMDGTYFSNITLTPILPLALWTGINGATWDASTTTNFANNALNDPLNNTTFDVAKAADDSVTFADHYWDNSTNTVVTQNSVTIAAGGVSVGNVDFQNNSVDYTISGADATGITGTTALTINGAGTLTLSTANTYTGGTTLSNGTLIVGNSDAIGTNTLTLAGGTLRNGATGVTLDEAIVVSGTASAFAGSANMGLAGDISGAGTLNVGGSGSGQGADSRFNISANTLNGFTGTLNLDTTENYVDIRSMNTSAKLMTSGATSGQYVRMWGNSTFGELSGTGGNIQGDDGTLTINQSTDTTYAGVLSEVNNNNELAFAKTGSGRLTLLSDLNSYEWQTTVNGGVLEVQGRLNETRWITVAGGATFELTGSGSLGAGGVYNGGLAGDGNITINGTFTYNSTTDQELGGLVTVNSGGHLSYGAAAGTLTLSGGLTLNDGVSLDYEVDAGGSGSKINITGGTFTGAASDDGVTVNVTMSGTPTGPVTYTLLDWSGAAVSGVNIEDFNLVYSGDSAVGSLSIVGDTLVLKAGLAGTVILVY